MSAFAKEGDFTEEKQLGERKNKYACAAGIATMATGAAVCIIGALRDEVMIADIAKTIYSELLTYVDDILWTMNFAQQEELSKRKNKYACAAGIAMMAAGAAVCIIGALRDGIKSADIANTISSQLVTYVDDIAWIKNKVS